MAKSPKRKSRGRLNQKTMNMRLRSAKVSDATPPSSPSSPLDELDDPGVTSSKSLMRTWLIHKAEFATYKGLKWLDENKTMMRIPWQHGSSQVWVPEDTALYKDWAKHSGELVVFGRGVYSWWVTTVPCLCIFHLGDMLLCRPGNIYLYIVWLPFSSAETSHLGCSQSQSNAVETTDNQTQSFRALQLHSIIWLTVFKGSYLSHFLEYLKIKKALQNEYDFLCREYTLNP